MANRKLKSLKFPGIDDTYILDAGNVNYSDEETYEEGSVGEGLNALKEDIKDNYAKNDGYYDGMTVGNAEQIVGTVFEEDDTAYNRRTTGGSAEVGDRAYVESITGGSLVWNQLVSDPLLTDASKVAARECDVVLNDGIATATPTSGGTERGCKFAFESNAIVQHKYLAMAFVKTTTSGSIRVGFNGGGYTIDRAISAGVWSLIGGVIGTTGTTLTFLTFYQVNSLTTSDSIQYKTPMLFDLTAMFGSTIADYIYSLETAHAGDGVAWFKRYFPKPYYAYHAVGMEHVNSVAAKTVGFNQWDEEWESGSLNFETGATVSNSSRIRSKNYIPILPNTSYRFDVTPQTNYTGAILVTYYDADKNYLGYVSTKNFNRTTPSDARYAKFSTDDYWGVGKAYTGGFCYHIEWDNSRDGDYEPYNLHTYPLADLTLRGIPKKDESGNLYFDGDRYLPDGTVERRYGIVDLGTLSWSFVADPEWNCFIANVSDKKGGSKCICEKYPIGVIYNTANEKVMSGNDANGYIYIRDSSYTSASDFKTAMSGVMYVYELATPTTEEADPYQYPMVVDNWGTEELIDGKVESGDRDVAIPVGHETKYPPNLKDKLESAANNPDADGAYILTHDGGSNTYTPLASNPTIQNIIARLEALEGGGE